MYKDIDSICTSASAAVTRHHTSIYEIDLAAIQTNLVHIYNMVNMGRKSVKVMPVVKGNAYGHGAVDVVDALWQLNKKLSVLEPGCDKQTSSASIVHGFAVNRLLEGVEIRRARCIPGNVPILVLGFEAPEEMQDVVDHWLMPTLTEREQVVALQSCLQTSSRLDCNKRLPIHIKVDTGMGRLGLLPDELDSFVSFVLQEAPNLQIDGLFTHFAVADDMNNEENVRFTKNQLGTFLQAATSARKKIATTEGRAESDILLHCANSAGTLFHPDSWLDMVRPGVCIYGMHPANDNSVETPIPLQHAISWKSRVARVKRLKSGSNISYGRTYRTQNPAGELVALIPVGYGDGYHRSLSNKGHVLIHGIMCPVRGRVCMDQFVVSVDHLQDVVSVGDEVVLLGAQHGKCITAEQLSQWCGTINYEVTTSLLHRIPRVYEFNGVTRERTIAMHGESKSL